ncbi:MAG: 50S ribosomal protein L24 [Thermoplasmatota archaeon]
MKSIKARKQRKAFFNAPLHQKRKQISSHLEENLLLKYDRRGLPVVKGDTVKVMRGMHRNHENKVTLVHVKDNLVEVEGVTITKADGKKVARPVHPSNLLITKLNLTDKWRRRNLEKELPEDKRKEIETEAKTQLKQLEEQLKAQEALAEEGDGEEELEEPKEPIEGTVEEPVKEEKEQIKQPDESKPTKQPRKTAERKRTSTEAEKEPKPAGKKKKPVKQTGTGKERAKKEKKA